MAHVVPEPLQEQVKSSALQLFIGITMLVSHTHKQRASDFF